MSVIPDIEYDIFTELPVVYCRDNAAVQAFVAERMRDFNSEETTRDILDAAVKEFGLLNCFWFEIELH